MNNDDVRGKSPLSALFGNDFWGRDIKSQFSHKSYRPLTALTFRMDHVVHGMDAYGYHATNVALYVLCCLSMFWLCKMWLSLKSTHFASSPLSPFADDVVA